MNILILGGYGVFGGRLVRLLADRDEVTLLVAGRSLERATPFCAGVVPRRAGIEPVRLDRDGDVGAHLARYKPDLVVDASGPFQVYGDRPYRVVEACLAAGISYVDLADGSDFVAGIGAFDGAATAKGIFVLSGVSSCPVLTAAAVRRLAEGMSAVTEVSGGISPSPRARPGLNVVRAIASYAGRAVTRQRGGRTVTAHAFTEQRRQTIAPPGHRPLGSRLFSLVDVPDLTALPVLWPDARDVWFGAGPMPAILHRVLIGLAWLRRWKLLPPLTPLAGVMQWVLGRARWGEDRGGMYVAVSGRAADGRAVRRTWHLLAEGDDGPMIPSMGVAALVARLLDGDAPQPGARAGARDLELADYEALFAPRRIVTGVRDDAADGPVFARVLGDAWDALPPAIRAGHGVGDVALTMHGTACVRRGRHPLARVVAALFGFPRPAENVPLTVTMTPERGGETWVRQFGTTTLRSHLSEGKGRRAHLVVERFGPFAISIALVRDGGALRYVLRGWRLFGIPLPSWLGPTTVTHEAEIDGRFHFSVEIAHPWLGLISAYEGALETKTAQPVKAAPLP